MSSAHTCLSRGTEAAGGSAVAPGSVSGGGGHHHVAAASLPRASSPRPAYYHHPPPPHHHQNHPLHHHHHHRAIILHPRHAYRLPRPLPVVLPAGRTATTTSLLLRSPLSSSSSPPLDLALPIDALTSIAARLGDGRSLAAFAATCRACMHAAYDERLWKAECERRFGPVMPAGPAATGGAAVTGVGVGVGVAASSSSCSPPSSFSWRRLYAFNAAAYESVVAATRQAQRSAAMARVLGGAAARRLASAWSPPVW
jgi:hypothetical protein